MYRSGSRFAGGMRPAVTMWNRAPRGATAVIVAICLVMLCAFLALALNVGHLFSVKGELQNAADSAALAGAQDLDGTLVPITSTQSLVGAIPSGSDFASRHATDTATGVEVKAGDVEIGYWNVQTRLFTAYPTTVSADFASCRTLPCINAVRARSYRDPNHSSSVPIAFGALLGKLTSDVGAEAVAVTGGPCGMRCIGLPIVLPDCGVDPFFGPPCVGGEYTVLFKNDWTDTAAWADLGSGANTIKCLLEQSLANAGQCVVDTSCKVDTDLTVTEAVEVINGQVNSACELITTLYRLHPEYKYVVPVVHAPCSAKWVQNFPINKFATVQISWAPDDCTGAENKYFKVKVLCDEVTNNASAGGCAAAGTWVRPGLVK